MGIGWTERVRRRCLCSGIGLYRDLAINQKSRNGETLKGGDDQSSGAKHRPPPDDDGRCSLILRALPRAAPGRLGFLVQIVTG
jgi:hypothetical protein